MVKGFRSHPAVDRQVISSGLQVLADGQNVDVGSIPQILHQLEDLVVAFANADHDSGFGDQS